MPRPRQGAGADHRRSRTRSSSSRRRLLLAVAVLLVAVAVVPCGSSTPPAGSALVVLAGSGPGGTLRTRIVLVEPRGNRRELTDDFDAASAPAVSHDRRHFVFRGRRQAGDAPGLWEKAFTDTDAALVTAGNGEPDHPVYLPGDRVLYSDRPEEGGSDGARALFVVARGGAPPERVTFGAFSDDHPRVLPSGHIAFERRSTAPARRGAVWALTIRPDGTGVAAHVEETDDRRIPTAHEPAAGGAAEEVLERVGIGQPWAPSSRKSAVKSELRTGSLLCLDVTRSRLPAIRAREPGTLRGVRLDLETPAPGRASDREGRWPTEVPVLSDGSFHVEVPADTALTLTLVDREGNDLATCAVGLWVRPGETRGCVGCHEPALSAPANRFPLAAVPVGRHAP